MFMNKWGSKLHRTLLEIFDTSAKFLTAYKTSGIYQVESTKEAADPAYHGNKLSDEDALTVYYLLTARFGNTPIASETEIQFKDRLWAIIYMEGPSWSRRVGIQNQLRNLSEDELRLGSKVIYNHAFNPGTVPSTGSLEELQGINEQNSTNNKRGIIEALTALYAILDKDITTEFLNKFQPLFLRIFTPICQAAPAPTTKLSTPQNVALNFPMTSWDAVDNAEDYDFYVDNDDEENYIGGYL